MEIKLVIEGLEYKVGYGFLQDIVSSIPDTPVYEELFLQLAKNPNAEIRRDIAWKDNLSLETVKLLLKDQNRGVLERILTHSKVESIMTTKKLKKFISMGDAEMVKIIIQNISNYEDIDIDEVVACILDLGDPGLTLALASGWNVPKRVLKRLAAADDIDIAYTAKNSLE